MCIVCIVFCLVLYCVSVQVPYVLLCIVEGCIEFRYWVGRLFFFFRRHAHSEQSTCVHAQIVMIATCGCHEYPGYLMSELSRAPHAHTPTSPTHPATQLFNDINDPPINTPTRPSTHPHPHFLHFQRFQRAQMPLDAYASLSDMVTCSQRAHPFYNPTLRQQTLPSSRRKRYKPWWNKLYTCH